MRRIIYREDGGVSVVIPAINSRKFHLNPELKVDDFAGIPIEIQTKLLKINEIVVKRKCGVALQFEKDNPGTFIFEDENRWLERVFTKATPEGVDFEDINEGTNPLPSRRFRNAWSKGISGLEVNLPKAKDQVMSELRTVRNQELMRTDGLMARANEIGTSIEIADLKMQRQKLRDLPVTIGVEAIASVGELEAKYLGVVTIQSLKASGELPEDCK